MLGHPHTNRVFLGMQHHLGDVSGGPQNERVPPRNCCLDGTEHPVLHLDVLAHLSEFAHDEGEVVLLGQLTNLPDAFQSSLVAQSTSKGIARIGRVGDETTVPKGVDHLVQRASLRVVRVHRIVLGHEVHPRQMHGVPESFRNQLLICGRTNTWHPPDPSHDPCRPRSVRSFPAVRPRAP